MTTVDLIVQGGTVVSATREVRADVAIHQGRIVRVGPVDDLRATRVIDAAGCHVLPGIIDAHTHPVYADDLASTARAGIAGGVTTTIAFIAAFPSWGFPKTGPAEVADAYIAEWDGRPAGDFALHVAFDSHDDPAVEVPELIRRGITSFKFFTAYPRRGMMVDDRSLIAGLEVVGKAGGIAAVHAENGHGIDFLESRLWDTPDLPNETFLQCHTHLFETEAVLRVISLAEAVGCPLYIPHLAAGDGIEVVGLARRTARVPVWIETCPHYLVLTNDEVLRRGALSKIAPPLRETGDNERLWAAVADGMIQVVGTDHAGRTLASKAEGANILQAPFGAEGIEHLLPLMYGEGVAGGRLSLRRMVAVLAENPADLFDLPAKGRIEEGKDADLVILDPDGRTACTAADHAGASDYCLYEGREVPGRVRHTIKGGRVLLDDGVLADDLTGGRYLARRPLGRRPVPVLDGVPTP
ncbi:dihydropyrimidinase [Sphaerisporangium rufum]|uniref:D-hydantoinase n=1 Tax=Sphaerisporangium rufum TaxID=1381558 RepID=A0A919R063_9ACTN|nr:amidohydrolase family protein [Sphaerisporangium rufum]GII76000.1 dihydropyrimidinase [Sphaerisporangium rufum]